MGRRERVPGQRRVPAQRRGRSRAVRSALGSARGDGPRPRASRTRRGWRLRAGAQQGGYARGARAGRAYPHGVPRVLQEGLDGLRVVRPRGRTPRGRRHRRDVRSRARLSTRRYLLALLHRRRRRRVHEGRALAGRGARNTRRGHRDDARARRASRRATSLPGARALRDEPTTTLTENKRLLFFDARRRARHGNRRAQRVGARCATARRRVHSPPRRLGGGVESRRGGCAAALGAGSDGWAPGPARVRHARGGGPAPRRGAHSSRDAF